MPATREPPENENERPKKSRLESEIEEILARSETESTMPPPTPFRRSPAKRNVRESLRKVPLQSISSSARHWLDAAPIVVAFVLAIVALLISNFSPFFATIAAFFSVLALFWPVITGLRNHRGSQQKMWRGRPYEISSIEPTPFDRFRYWLRDRKDGH